MAIVMPTPTTGGESEIIYPESDGKPLADNTLQDEWIAVIKSGYLALYADNPDVFVGGNLLWYPTQGRPQIVAAPDVFVVFDRPKGYRGSYKQWEENGVPMQVVWEILSPSNRPGEMAAKALFYGDYGVEEYYIYDPHRQEFDILFRSADTGRLEPVPDPSTFVSPRTGVRFAMQNELVIYRPDGEPFKPFAQVMADRNAAEQRATQEAERADQEAERAERLAAKLRELGVDPDTV